MSQKAFFWHHQGWLIPLWSAKSPQVASAALRRGDTMARKPSQWHGRMWHIEYHQINPRHQKKMDRDHFKNLDLPQEMDKLTIPKQCQYIYMNLLQLPLSEKLPRSDAYVRYLFQCNHCDTNGLKDILEAYTEFMGEQTTKRILHREATARDILVAEDAVIHYQKWTREQLVTKLTWPNYFRHSTFVWRTELMVKFGVSASIGMWKIVIPRVPSFCKGFDSDNNRTGYRSSP